MKEKSSIITRTRYNGQKYRTVRILKNYSLRKRVMIVEEAEKENYNQTYTKRDQRELQYNIIGWDDTREVLEREHGNLVCWTERG